MKCLTIIYLHANIGLARLLGERGVVAGEMQATASSRITVAVVRATFANNDAHIDSDILAVHVDLGELLETYQQWVPSLLLGGGLI